MVSATRSITWRSEVSRSAEPSVPRKYFWATMLVAFRLQPTGNSTPSCSKATEPSFQFEMRASRRSHTTWSYGCTPGLVKWRWIPMPVRSGAMDMGGSPLKVDRWGWWNREPRSTDLGSCGARCEGRRPAAGTEATDEPNWRNSGVMTAPMPRGPPRGSRITTR
jgi:hypothetical protein